MEKAQISSDWRRGCVPRNSRRISKRHKSESSCKDFRKIKKEYHSTVNARVDEREWGTSAVFLRRADEPMFLLTWTTKLFPYSLATSQRDNVNRNDINRKIPAFFRRSTTDDLKKKNFCKMSQSRPWMRSYEKYLIEFVLANSNEKLMRKPRNVLLNGGANKKKKSTCIFYERTKKNRSTETFRKHERPRAFQTHARPKSQGMTRNPRHVFSSLSFLPFLVLVDRDRKSRPGEAVAVRRKKLCHRTGWFWNSDAVGPEWNKHDSCWEHATGRVAHNHRTLFVTTPLLLWDRRIFLKNVLKWVLARITRDFPAWNRFWVAWNATQTCRWNWEDKHGNAIFDRALPW